MANHRCVKVFTEFKSVNLLLKPTCCSECEKCVLDLTVPTNRTSSVCFRNVRYNLPCANLCPLCAPKVSKVHDSEAWLMEHLQSPMYINIHTSKLWRKKVFCSFFSQLYISFIMLNHAKKMEISNHVHCWTIRVGFKIPPPLLPE